MVRKPDIQYVGQFYTYGSEAKEVALQPKKAKTTLPLERLRNIQQIYVDPVAWFGIAVSIVMVITMVIGALNIRNAWAEYEVMHGYVTELQQENVRLELRYQLEYPLYYLNTFPNQHLLSMLYNQRNLEFYTWHSR